MNTKKETFVPLFNCSDDINNNSCVNWCNDSLELYAIAYKKAADSLVKEALDSRDRLDTLVYPIVFLYRQYIELRLKEIIREGRKLLEEPGNFPMHHRIHELWPIAKAIIEKVPDYETGNLDIEFIEHVLTEFSRYDPESFSFRYPTDKKGNNPLSGLTHINLRHLGDTVNRLATLLDRESIGISMYIEWQNEMYSSI